MPELSKPDDLETVYSRHKWRDLVFRSDLSMTTKVVASVIESTCTYQRKVQMQLSAISAYSISRIIKVSPPEVQQHLDLLFENGWLFDTGFGSGAKKVYGLTFRLKPDGTMRT